MGWGSRGRTGEAAEGGKWLETSIDLKEKRVFNGKLIYKFHHAIAHVDKRSEIAYIQNICKEYKETISGQGATQDSGSKVRFSI